MVYGGGVPIVPDGYVGDPTVEPTRRMLPAAIVQCEKLGIKGNTNISVYDMEIADVFITEAVGPPPANKSPVVVEIVRMRTTSTYDSLISNVRLVD